MKRKNVFNSIVAVTCFVALVSTACSKQESSGTANEIYNQAYMGAEKDLYGNDVTIGTGPNGQAANQRMIDYEAQYEEAQVYKVTESVYMANGYGTANSIMIEGEKGLTIINTGNCEETAKKEYEAFKKVSDKPVINIIYTNYQYSAGTSAYVTADNKEQVQIIAHEGHDLQMDQLISETTPIYAERKAIAEGLLIGNEGENGALGNGLGAWENSEKETFGYVAPTKLLPGDEVTSMKIDGVNMQFIPAESDSPDNFIIWLPDDKVCINDLALPSFPDISSLNGGTYRDPKIWVQGLNEIIDLKPDYLVGIYGLPLTKDDDVNKELILYRDALQFVYNQTVRYMNKKYSVDQIIQSVKLTDTLAAGKLAGEFFGEIDYHVRGIFSGLMGWFGNDTIELHPVTDEFEAMKIVEGYGGTDKVIAVGQKALEDKQYSWAVQLSEYVLKNEPDNKEAIAVKVDALRSMARVTTASDTRNCYLTEAARLEGNLKEIPTNGVTKEKLMASSRDSFFKILRVSIDPEKCGDTYYYVNFNFTDENVQYGFEIRKGLGKIIENPQATDIEVQVSYDTFCEIASGIKSMDEAIQSGDMVIKGDINLFQQFRSVFDIIL